MRETALTPTRVLLHAHVAPELRAKLRARARANDRSIAAEVRRALTQYVDADHDAREHDG